MSSFSIVYSETFARDQRRFVAQRDLLADLTLTVAEIARQPFKNPQLETHRVKGAQPGVMTSYVGSQQHRVIWFKAGQTAVLLLFDRHDEAYRRAGRLRVSFDGDDAVQVVEQQAVPEDAVNVASGAQSLGPAPFDPWDNTLLREVGFAEHEINLLREARDDSGVLGLQRFLSPEAFERALQVATAVSEDDVRAVGAPAQAPEETTPDESVVGEQVQERVAAGTAGLASISAEDIAAVLSRPIEDWMVFLHPDQRALVERRFSGPARITGGAGTGKTVVGVHRAARLAAAGNRVLFTTYISTLPKVLETLYRRLSPATDDRVTFIGVHAYALSILPGLRARPDREQADAAFNEAWRKAAPRGSALRELGLGTQYFRDELAWIIKGRGLTVEDGDAYIRSPRTGRGTAFAQNVREQIWDLYLHYERRLRARNVVDFEDVLTLARDHIRAHGDPGGFDAVIVDEAQDLTRVGLEFVAAIAGDRADGLLLLGDGQQSLYPGGHSLRAIGIDVRGRAAVLRLNYRNTSEILATANRVVAGRSFDDGDEDVLRAEPMERMDVPRHGESPTIRRFENLDDHDEDLTLTIEQLAAREDTDLGDIGVLVPTTALMRTYAVRISELGLACRTLDRYDGSPTSEVKVGTFKRSKGLEFKHVLVPRAEPEVLRDAAAPGEDAATHEERLDRTRRELFVALTRARDSVWLGHVGEPSALLHPASN